MTARFDAFVLLAEMRTGSNHLEASLNALDGVACLGELFNPHFFGAHNKDAWEGVSQAQRDADPLDVLARVVDRDDLGGFRLFHDHDPRVVDAVLPEPGIAKIVLGRNPLESYVSWKIAQETGQWRLTNPKMAKGGRARFDGAEFDAMLDAQAAFRSRVARALQVTGQTAFWMDYADIGDVEVVNGIAAFLGVEARLDAIPGRLKRQNPGEVADKVENPDEMRAHLARADPFRLSVLPGTEPPRGPGVPAMMAAGDVLCLPVPGGPTEALRRWASGLGETTESMTQKDLRRWMRHHPGHHAVAVVSHPLIRAGRVLDALLEEGGEVRRLLVRHYGAPGPERGAVDEADRPAWLEAFLRFARANLGGQTAMPAGGPAGAWGHQVAALQGIARVVPPTRVLREEEAPEELARLAPGAPRWDAALPPAGPSDDAGLAALAHEVWRRDYLVLGYPADPAG